MISTSNFIEAYQQFQMSIISFRLLQDQAFVMMGLCSIQQFSIPDATAVTDREIKWLLLQPEAAFDYAEYLGGNVFVCETANDLKQVVGCDFAWAEEHHGQWPNVTDKPISWDGCMYLPEINGEAQWVMFLQCWNNAGGPVYYVPRNLWEFARVTEHMAATNELRNS